MEDLSGAKTGGPDDDLLAFVRRRQVQTYTTLDKLKEVLGGEKQNQPQMLPPARV